MLVAVGSGDDVQIHRAPAALDSLGSEALCGLVGDDGERFGHGAAEEGFSSGDDAVDDEDGLAARPGADEAGPGDDAL